MASTLMKAHLYIRTASPQGPWAGGLPESSMLQAEAATNALRRIRILEIETRTGLLTRESVREITPLEQEARPQE